MLLLIVGDGIRENAEKLLAFLNRFGEFFASACGSVNLVTPRVLAKRVLLDRAVNSYMDQPERRHGARAASQRSSITEEECY